MLETKVKLTWNKTLIHFHQKFFVEFAAKLGLRGKERQVKSYDQRLRKKFYEERDMDIFDFVINIGKDLGEIDSKTEDSLYAC